jgi:4-carboxymuconolactone decarboxylase
MEISSSGSRIDIGASAVAIARDIFTTRRVGVDQLPRATDELLPVDGAAEAQRAAGVAATYGSVPPGIVQYTTDLLFRELWRRPALAPRDRSLVTVSALIASGQVEQISYHLDRAIDSGLTKAEASEVLTHLAFYAGWPNVFFSTAGGEERHGIQRSAAHHVSPHAEGPQSAPVQDAG